MNVPGGGLEVPLHFAGIGVEGDDALGVEVVAFADVAVEIGGGVAGAPVEEIQLGIVGAGEPGAAAAGFPGVAGPGVVAGFAGAGDGVPAPETFAGVGVIGVEEAVEAMIAGGDAHDDFILDDHGRGGGPIAFGGFGDFGFPEHGSVTSVEGDQVGVGGAEVDFIAVDGDAAVGASLQRGLAFIAPDFTALAGVEGVDFVGIGEVHDAIDDDGNGFQAAGGVDVVHPFGDKPLGVFGIDLFEKRMALGVILAVVMEPVSGARFE